MATTLPPSSTLTANEKLVDLYMERAVDLLRLEAGTRDKVLVFLSELENEIVGQIAKINPTGDPSIIRQRNRLAKLLDEVRSTIKGTYRDVSTLMAREIRDIADNEATWTGHAINAATSATFADVGLTSAFLSSIVENSSFLGGASKDWWSRQAGGLFDKFADEMRRGVALGESNAKLIDRVRGTTGQPGIMDISRNSAERLVRASVQSAANTAREAMYERNDDLIVSLQWHATLDTRTSEWCITRDGHHYSNDAEHKSKDGGPAWLEGPGKLHWGCLTGDALVTTRHGINAATKRWYDGQLVVIRTASGKELTSTPNHPILTDTGWVAAGLVDVGDNVVCDGRSEWQMSRLDVNHEYVPTAIEEVAEASFRSSEMLTGPVPTAAEDFHGDGMQGDIAIVATNSLLKHRN